VVTSTATEALGLVVEGDIVFELQIATDHFKAGVVDRLGIPVACIHVCGGDRTDHSTG